MQNACDFSYAHAKNKHICSCKNAQEPGKWVDVRKIRQNACECSDTYAKCM